MCNCGNTISTSNCQTTDCACPVKDLSTDCVLYTGNDLPCTEIKTGTLLTEVFGQLDTYLCDLSTQLANAFSLISVGEGIRVYKGVDGIGRKEIRSLINTDGFLNINLSENDKEIDFTVDQIVLKEFVQDNQITYSAANVGVGAGIYKDAVRTADNVNFSFKKIKSDGTIIITENSNDINIAVDGSETKATAGTAISISGNGTVATPYIVTNTAPDQVVSITGGGATTVSGSYPNFTVSSTDNDTTYSAGPGLTLSGTTFGVDNLQKTISGSYTLTDADDNYEILINNVATPAIITVPSGLKARINVGFIQQGTADVTFLESGVTINSPLNMKKIKGQNYNAYITQVENTNVYQLVGNLKLV